MRSLKLTTCTPTITDRTDDSVREYLNIIAKAKRLSKEEELAIFEIIKGDDADAAQKASEKLIKSNLRFVISVAKNYQNQGLSLADLIQEGNMGMIKAIPYFTPEAGVQFTTFAVWYIRREIISAINAAGSTTSLPGNASIMLRSIKKAKAIIEQREEREATVAEIAEFIGEDSDKVADMIAIAMKSSSLDSPISSSDDDSSNMGDVIADTKVPSADANLSAEDMHNSVMAMLHKVLDKREMQIIVDSFGIGCRQKLNWEIAEDFNMTETRVLQIKNSAIEKLRKYRGAKNLLAYL